MDEKPLILIADDEEYFRNIFSIKLKAEGFRVETAENGEEAVQKAGKLRPDLILMDVRMPKMDGINATLKLKEDQDTKDIKVVFLTSLGEPREGLEGTDVQVAKDIGAADYVRKSDDLKILVQKINALLGKT